MGDSSGPDSPDVVAKASKNKEDSPSFAEQLLLLRRQQDEQYHRLTQQYKEQQDLLYEQQQQELKQHYKRQMILNPTHKMPAKTFHYHHYTNDKIPPFQLDRGDDNKNHGNEAQSSTAFSAHVRNKVRKKALENINKKNSFQHVDPQHMFPLPRSRHTEFNQWAFESQAYNQEDEDLIPLRKAASEPNLKGRNTFKHRVRLKPAMENSRHPSYSPGESRYEERRDERREAISPPYTKPIEGRVFSQGPRNAHPLFQSPSLPNINLDSKRSQLHFPTHMSTLSKRAKAASPEMKAPLKPGHPKYLDMLKTQYETNHRYLKNIMLKHNYDPIEIDLFHQQYLSKFEGQPMSDEHRVKQLLESQNKLYLHLTELFGQSPAAYSPEMSKSLSKLHTVSSAEPPTNLVQSHSHDSLQKIKYVRDDYFSPPGMPPHLRFAPGAVHHHAGSDYPAAPYKSISQPARMRLKEHLREKQQDIYKPHAMEAHFQRLADTEDKIQEETAEDVEKEAKRTELPPKVVGELPASQQGSLLHANRMYSSTSRLYSSNPRLHGSNPKLNGGVKHHGSDSRLHKPPADRPPQHKPLDMDLEANRPAPKVSRNMTGLVYDTIMLKHACACGGNYPLHPESAGRLQSIWARLQETGVANMCERICPRKATMSELQTVHSEKHTLLFGGGGPKKEGSTQNLRCFATLECGGVGVDSSTVWNETHTSNAARMAAGCVIELAFKVASNELKNGFAIVRPPGHHAETHQAMGSCYFNSIAIAAKLLCMKSAVERVLIFDWDIHHGNGTQQMFYDDDRVCYISIHRHDNGAFFPGTGKAEECGAGTGMGCNINIAFNDGIEPEYGDKEYLAAFRTIVMPVVKEFKPDIVLVSAGFDAAKGHSEQLGGYNVSAACFAYMTRQLMLHTNGKLVLSLEGGYVLQSLCDASENCIRALLDNPTAELSDETKRGVPNKSAVASLEKVVKLQEKYWSGVRRAAHHMTSSFNGALKTEKEEADTVSALASLSMHVVQKSNASVEYKERSTNEEPMEEN